MKERITWLDSLKGLGISFIVLGHTLFPFNQYVYWFHVPLFFILSGIVLNINYDTKVFFEKKIKSLIKPYFIYGIILIFLNSLLFKEPLSIIKNLLFLIYGGKQITGVIGAFWFVPTLFIAEIIIYFLLKNLSYKKSLLLALIAYTCMSIIEKYFLKGFALPWNIDVVPISIMFLLIGYGFKTSITNNSTKKLGISSCLLLLLIVNNYIFDINYTLDLKYYTGSFVIQDILIPTSISLILILSFSIFSHLDTIFLQEIGKKSLVIMFMHNFFIKVFTHFFSDNWLFNFLFALLMSYFLAILISKTKNSKFN